jgi:hypothetical protein
MSSGGRSVYTRSVFRLGHAVQVMLRTPYVLYLRCEHCLTMRTVRKPGYERQFGT